MNTALKTTIGRVAAGLAAVAMVAGASAASAYPRGHYDRGHHGNNGDTALVAGVVGLALGAAIASNGNNHGGGRYYSQPAYGYSQPAYGYGYGYAPPPPPRYYAPRGGYGYGYGRDCWTSREYDRYSGSVYERTVCR